MSQRDAGLPIEDFIHALTSQLDRAQSALALKAKVGLPLTFAVKDLSLDLRAHVDMTESAVRIRPAGPGDVETSVIHLSLTTITRPVIEENTRQLEAEPDDHQTLQDVLPDASEDERRRLEWAGIQTVKQLRDLQREHGEQAVERVAQIPVMRLRAALERASEPRITSITPETIQTPVSSGGTLLRIRGHNLLMESGASPTVRIGGEQVPVLHAGEKGLVVAPLPHQFSGTLSVEPSPGVVAVKEFNCQPAPLMTAAPATAANDPVPTANGREVAT
jgi:hypothetical protein